MKKKIIWIAAGIVLLIILGTAYIITCRNTNINTPNTKNIDTNAQLASNTPTNTQSVQDTVYVSHGQNVPANVVEEKYASLDPNLNVTKQEVADAIVTNDILLAKAKQNNIAATDAEVDDFISQQLTQYSISKEEYTQRLEAAGITEVQYKEQLKDQIMIAKLINESIKPDEYSVSDEEVNAFMEAHKEDYESLDSNMLALIKQRIKSQMIEKKKIDLVNNYVKNCGLKSTVSSS